MKANNKAISFILILCLMITLMPMTPVMSVKAEAATWDGTASTSLSGSGTSTDPYLIQSAADLAYMRNQVNTKGAINGNAVTTASIAYYKQTADIVLNDGTFDENGNYTANDGFSTANVWEPIGNDYNVFKGSYDGSNNTIKGLYINSQANYQGMFGILDTASISGIGLVDNYINGAAYVGGIAGLVSATSTTTTSIQYCYNSGTVKGSTYVGGVVGVVLYNFSMDHVYNSGLVVGSESVGGLVGYFKYITNVSGAYTISINQSFNTGTIRGDKRVGGIIGDTDGYTKITNAYNTGMIIGSSATAGIAGSAINNVTIMGIYNAGEIIQTGSTANAKIASIVGSGTGMKLGKNYYDRQISYRTAFENTGVSDGITPKLTTEMLGSGLKSATNSDFFGSDLWVFTDGLYPRIKGMETLDASILSATPIILNAGDSIDPDIATRVRNPFSLSTDSGVQWFAGGSLISDPASITIDAAGITLSAIKNRFSKYVFIKAPPSASNISWYDAGQAAIRGTDYTISGTTITIYNAKGLAWLAWMTNTNPGNIDGFSGKTIELGANIDLDGVVTGYGTNADKCWIPIGMAATAVAGALPFKGTFDGKGYTISNLEINKSNYGSLGLFGFINNATIQNVGIESGTVTGHDSLGGIAGYAYKSTIQSCFNKATIQGNNFLGGIAGNIYDSIIRNCYNTADIGNSDNTNYSAGGVVGLMQSSTGGTGALSTTCIVTQCYNTGTVYGNTLVGGIAGSVGYLMSNTYNPGGIITQSVSLGKALFPGMYDYLNQQWGRVGRNPSNSNLCPATFLNYAWIGMTMGWGGKMTEGNGTYSHGENLTYDVNSNNLSKQFSEIFTSGSAWTFADNKLPVLNVFGSNQSDSLPSWIVPTVPAIETTTLPNGTVGTAYSQTITATGTTPITWSAINSSLPAGLTLNQSSGVISGTPTTTGTTNLTVQAVNVAGSATKSFTITINAAASGNQASAAALFSAKFTKDQLFDVQRSPAFPVGGSIFRLSGLKAPYNQNLGSVSLASGDYVKFEYISSVAAISTASQTAIANSIKWYYINPTNLAKAAVVKEVQYDSGNAVKATLSNYGLIWALDKNNGFLYTALGGAYSMSGGIGTFVSFKPYPAGSIVSYIPNTADPVSLSAIDAVSDSYVPAGGTTGGITTASISGDVVRKFGTGAIMPMFDVNVIISYGGITKGAVTDERGQYIINFDNFDPSDTSYTMTITSGSSVSAINGTINTTTGSGFGSDDQNSDTAINSQAVPLMPYRPAPNPTVIIDDDFSATIAGITSASGVTISAASLETPSPGTVRIQVTGGFDASNTYYRILPTKPEAQLEGSLKQGAWTQLATSTASIAVSNGSYVEIIVTDQYGTILKWGVSEATADGYQAPGGNNNPGGNHDSSSSRDRDNSTNNVINPGTPGSSDYIGKSGEIVIGNKPFDGGAVEERKLDGKVITTVTFDEKKLGDLISSIKSGEEITIPIYSNSDGKQGEFSGKSIGDMIDKRIGLVIKTDEGVLRIPGGTLNLDGILGAYREETGKDVKKEDVKIIIRTVAIDGKMKQLIAELDRKENFSVKTLPASFTVTAEYQGRSKVIDQFTKYVERSMLLPAGTDLGKITTAIVVQPDGTYRHVPTKIKVINGIYHAVVKSYTNDVYALIYNPAAFPDVANRWSEKAVNDMASRMIINGIGGKFQPDRDITRAEFVSILVKSLGLPAGVGETSYADLESWRWYTPNANTAVTYGLASGISATTFGPSEKVDRQQAMNMIARAMKFTGIYPTMSSSEVDAILSKYSDSAQISAYARNSVAACLMAGAVNGKTATTIAPRAGISRAEVAAIIQRLLQKSNLI